MSGQVRPEDCPDPSVHGNPFRYCPYCTWTEDDEPDRQAALIAAGHAGMRLGAAWVEFWAALDKLGAVPTPPGPPSERLLEEL